MMSVHARQFQQHTQCENKAYPAFFSRRCSRGKNEVKAMDQKEKMLELIKKKQGGGRSKKMESPKNDRKNMRKGPKIYNK